jgi:hypothetical protein
MGMPASADALESPEPIESLGHNCQLSNAVFAHRIAVGRRPACHCPPANVDSLWRASAAGSLDDKSLEGVGWKINRKTTMLRSWKSLTRENIKGWSSRLILHIGR